MLSALKTLLLEDGFSYTLHQPFPSLRDGDDLLKVCRATTDSEMHLQHFCIFAQMRRNSSTFRIPDEPARASNERSITSSSGQKTKLNRAR